MTTNLFTVNDFDRAIDALSACGFKKIGEELPPYEAIGSVTWAGANVAPEKLAGFFVAQDLVSSQIPSEATARYGPLDNPLSSAIAIADSFADNNGRIYIPVDFPGFSVEDTAGVTPKGYKYAENTRLYFEYTGNPQETINAYLRAHGAKIGDKYGLRNQYSIVEASPSRLLIEDSYKGDVHIEASITPFDIAYELRSVCRKIKYS